MFTMKLLTSDDFIYHVVRYIWATHKVTRPIYHNRPDMHMKIADDNGKTPSRLNAPFISLVNFKNPKLWLSRVAGEKS